MVIVTGMTAEEGGEAFGVDVGDSEEAVSRTGFLTALISRGLAGVDFVISDAHLCL